MKEKQSGCLDGISCSTCCASVSTSVVLTYNNKTCHIELWEINEVEESEEDQFDDNDGENYYSKKRE